jgi:hypothetical protein
MDVEPRRDASHPFDRREPSPVTGTIACARACDYLDGKIERIRIAGWITGQARLISGQIVPVVRPELRCCYTWTTQALVTSVAGPEPKESANQKDRDMHTKRVEGVRNFLERA